MVLNLPPLNALRAFEAAARCGSYVSAAKELNVSPAAISQHIRNLEGFLGKHLFTRHNNRVVLTDAGQDIFQNIHQSFTEIAHATARAMGARPRARLVISALPSVSERWLSPRLARFAAAHPNFRFELREDNASDFSRGEIDLRVAYGAEAAPDLVVQPLLHDEVVPLCAPAYAAKLRAVGEDLRGLSDEDLIHTEWGPDFGSRPGWQDWCNTFSAGRKIEATGHQASHSSLALALAERGLGVTLGQKMLAAEALQDGRLVMLSPHAIKLGHAYYLIYPRSKAHKPMLQALVASLNRTEA